MDTMGNVLSKTLELTIRLHQTEVEVDVYEPESGEVDQLQLPYSPDEHPEFDERLGQEIYSWIGMWMDQLQETAE